VEQTTRSWAVTSPEPSPELAMFAESNGVAHETATKDSTDITESAARAGPTVI
jgi:hypothetical protein